jgi:hypothetical protein
MEKARVVGAAAHNLPRLIYTMLTKGKKYAHCLTFAGLWVFSQS